MDQDRINLVTIEGNIGVGKSTLMESLKSFDWADADISVVFIDEPVEEWLEYGLLQNLYDQNISAEAFQYAALSSVVAHTCKAIMEAPPGTKLFIAERSVASNMQVFAKASIRDAPQLRTFEYAYAHIVSSLPQNISYQHLLLQTYPEICMARIKQRARTSESAITLEYLRELHDLHSAWMHHSEAGPNAPKWHVVDAARDSQSVVVEALGIIMSIVAALVVNAM